MALKNIFFIDSALNKYYKTQISLL